MTPRQIEVNLPEKALFLLTEQWRYKGLKGGRGSGKSRSMSAALVMRGARAPERWLCARETQKSLEFSSRQILVDQINRLGLQDHYEVLANQIRGRYTAPDGRRTVFVFEGIKEASADALKSMEDFDGCWIAEAHGVSKASWDKLTPTFRKETAEIWFDFNPDLEDDFIYRFCENPPPNAKVVTMNYWDNPWFPDVLRVDMEHMKATDYPNYLHIWAGKPKSAADGAIFSNEMRAVDAESRICRVPYDRTKPVYTVWDLGYLDPTAVWFVQPYGGYLNFIDYEEENKLSIADWIIKIQQKQYMLGTAFLPHDAAQNFTHKHLVGAADRTMSIPTIMQEAGFRVELVAGLPQTDSLSAARAKFPVCRFDVDKCAGGIRSLRYYQIKEKQDGETKELHNWASHGSKAFIYACVRLSPTYSMARPNPPVLREQVIPSRGWA